MIETTQIQHGQIKPDPEGGLSAMKLEVHKHGRVRTNALERSSLSSCTAPSVARLFLTCLAQFYQTKDIYGVQ
jgi:hypothetical protein